LITKAIYTGTKTNVNKVVKASLNKIDTAISYGESFKAKMDKKLVRNGYQDRDGPQKCQWIYSRCNEIVVNADSDYERQ
jgi:hypothetical protein